MKYVSTSLAKSVLRPSELTEAASDAGIKKKFRIRGVTVVLSEKQMEDVMKIVWFY